MKFQGSKFAGKVWATLNLAVNGLIYRRLRAEAIDAATAGQAAESVLRRIETCARFAFRNHVGLFSDGTLENLAYRLGQDLQVTAAERAARDTDFAEDMEGGTLHVVTRVFPTGGHSRVLAKWISRDTATRHIVVFTQPQPTLPEFFERGVTDNQFRLVHIGQHKDIVEKSIALRLLAQRADRVILHTHPHDVVPVVAFAKAEGLPPIALFNHAHFSYCLGSTVADIHINVLPYYRQISMQHRFARDTALLPTIVGGLTTLRNLPVDKAKAKKALGLDADRVVLLAIAADRYFRPAFGYDFFRTTKRILDRLGQVSLVFVGVRDNCRYAPKSMKQDARVRFLGPLGDPTNVCQAADICLESFPVPSLGAVSLSVAVGEAFPVLAYEVGENILRVDRTARFQGAVRTRTEDEYVDYVVGLAESLDQTRAAAGRIRQDLIAMDALFQERLATLYKQIDGHRHSPGPIPAGRFRHELDDLLLAANSRPLLKRLHVFGRWSLAIGKVRHAYRRNMPWRIQSFLRQLTARLSR
jgi:hypothetical protein